MIRTESNKDILFSSFVFIETGSYKVILRSCLIGGLIKLIEAKLRNNCNTDADIDTFKQ